MSVLYKGKIIEHSLSKNAKGGTELIRSRLLRCFENDNILENFAIHFSRPDVIYENVKNIFYAHDLPEDQSNKFMFDNIEKFDKFIFVSNYQRDRYLQYGNIPLDKIDVIYNCIEDINLDIQRNEDVIRFIYHTTPHRGLDLLYQIFDKLSGKFDNIHLDVFSSYKIYGWGDTDQYESLYKRIAKHPNMTYHGTVSNEEIISTLRKSDVFLYPCIWEETYCLALTEAIANGVLCIHNNLGCLPETSFGNSFIYNYDNDKSVNATRAYQLTYKILQNFSDIRNSKINTIKNNFSVYGIPFTMDNFKHKWNEVLRGLHEK